jgi:hypothetical protein
MAYIVDSEVTTSPASASLTVQVPEGHREDDLILLAISQDSGATAIAVTGYTVVGTQAGEGGQRSVLFYKIATSASEADIALTGTNDEWIVTTIIIRDVDTTTPIHMSGKTTATDKSLASPTMTTTNNGCLCVNLVGFDMAGTFRLTEKNFHLAQNISKTINIGISQYVQYFNQVTAGLTPELEILNETAVEGGQSWVVAINDADPSSPQLPPIMSTKYEIINRYGLFGVQHETVTMGAISGVAPTTINGIAIEDKGTYTANGGSIADSPWGSYDIINSALLPADTAAGAWYGCLQTISSTSFTNKTFSLDWHVASNISVVGSGGWAIYFEDNAGNWAVYRISETTGVGVNTSYVWVASLPTVTPLDSGGTIDWSVIVKIGYMYHRISPSTGNHAFRWKNAILINNPIFIGGSIGSPIKPSEFSGSFNNHGMKDLAIKQGTNQGLLKSGVQLGNGTSKTYVKYTAGSHELPLPYAKSIGRRFYQVSTEYPANNLVINASANDTMDFSSSILATATKQNFTVHASSSPSATYNFNGCSIINYNVTNNVSGVTFNGAIFNECDIQINGGSLEGCTIADSTSPVDTNNPGSIADCDFTSAGTGHAIEATATGTFDFEGNTFTGYGANDSTNAAFYNNSGGLITLTIPATDTAPTIRNGAGASTTIAQPVENQKVTLTNLIIGSRVQIYDLTDDSELLNIVADATTEEWEDTNPYVADREIRVRVARQSTTAAKQFIEVNIGTLTSADPHVIYRVNQVDDEVYNTNAIDGSLVDNVAIVDSVLLAQIDTGAMSWQSLYAYELYWLTTETGIQEEGQLITAVDVVNYLFDDLVVTNVTSPEVPLIMSGGYARNKTTGLTIDVFDTSGGRIFNAPDHVVGYASGSGVTSQDKVDIANNVWTQSINGKQAQARLQGAEDNAELASIK